MANQDLINRIKAALKSGAATSPASSLTSSHKKHQFKVDIVEAKTAHGMTLTIAPIPINYKAGYTTDPEGLVVLWQAIQNASRARKLPIEVWPQINPHKSAKVSDWIPTLVMYGTKPKLALRPAN